MFGFVTFSKSFLQSKIPFVTFAECFLHSVIPFVTPAECFLQSVILLMMLKHCCPSNLFAEYFVKRDQVFVIILVHLKARDLTAQSNVQKCKYQLAPFHWQ